MMDANLVHIVDDDSSVRVALRRLIESEGFRVRVFESAEEFFDSADTTEPACLVLDVRMPGLNGLELQDKLNRAGLEFPIVFITGHGSIPMSVRAMRNGASDFIEKPFNDDDLLDSIHNALTNAAVKWEERDDLQHLRGRLQSLTPREFEVFRHVVTGMLNKQIAFKFGISEKTIKVHRARVMEKMQANALADLVRMATKLEISLPNRH